MEIISEQWTLDKVLDYIKQFKTTRDFNQDKKARAIKNWVSRYKGPNGEKIYIKDLLSGLDKTGSKRRDDDVVTKELEQQFPQWNFNNIKYRFPEKTNGKKLGRYLDGLYCPIKKEGIPHGVSDNINVRDLKKRGNGCRECGKQRIVDAIKLDFSQWIEDFPKDKDYIFDINNFYYRTEGLKNKTAFVTDVICTKHNPPVVFAKNGVNIHNLRMGKTGCPVCGKSESKGEKKVREELERLGYDVSKQKTFPGCFGFGGTRYCDLLKFDAYIIEKDGTEVCIEYDGIQHYEPQSNWGGEEGLKSTQERDKLKTEYCEKNNIKLIRIPYWEFGNVGKILEDELGNSSNDIMKSNLKKEYIVTESQLKAIVESKSAFIEKLRRRFNVESMRDYIYHAETEFPDPCSKFDNEFEFADSIIGAAVTEFLFQEELQDYFHSGDWSVIETEHAMITMCKDWFGDGLMGYYQTTCQDEFDDEDFDVMSEEYEIAPDKIIVKLFRLFNQYKKSSKTKQELLNIIMEFLPMFGISKAYATYMLELYLLNYREDGDYSGLNKNNFIDPRNKSGKKTANYQAGDYTKAQLPFQGSNLEGRWTKDRNGVKYYVVKSYGWYPVYIYKEGKWYENFDRYSSSTGKQMNNARPYTYNNEIDTKVYLMSKNEMNMLESGFSHEDVMKKKKESLKDVQPSPRITTAKSEYWRGDIPSLNIKFKISSIEDLGDKNAVNVDIYDVLKTENGKQIPTPENYLKGELGNVTPEKVEKEVERKLRQNFREYLGPKLGNQDEELVTFRFNHLKK